MSKPKCYICNADMESLGDLEIFDLDGHAKAEIYKCPTDGIGRIDGQRKQWLTSEELKELMA